MHNMLCLIGSHKTPFRYVCTYTCIHEHAKKKQHTILEYTLKDKKD